TVLLVVLELSFDAFLIGVTTMINYFPTEV
ncbi:MAG: hypothetical protein RLZZ139_2107, partial [Cyanobacteriota bacterium]